MRSQQTPKKKKLTILLLDDHFMQTWLSSEFILPLSQKFDLNVAVPANSKAKIDFNTSEVSVSYFTRFWSTRTQRVLFNLNWVGTRSKSSSFRFWIQRTILGNEFWNYRNRKYVVSQLKKISIMAIKDPSLFAAFITPVRLALRPIMEAIEKLQDKTASYIPTGTDIVIMPSQGGAEWDLPGLIRNCRRMGVLSVLSIDNWDNLTSKQVLRVKPDYVTVMGPRAVGQAIAIHGLLKANVLPIGLPRFDTYRKLSKFKFQSRIENNRFRINYLGFSLPYDEISVLNRLVLDLEKYEALPIEINYRPHPARKTRRVEAKPDIRINIFQADTRKKSKYVIPDPKEYADKVMNFDLIIASPTTMAIEIMALGRPCIIDATQDGIHRTSAGNSFDNYMHMQDLTTVPELRIARTYEELLSFVTEFYVDRPKSVNYQIDHLVNLQPKTYVEQLLESLPQ
jgi:hypothetical protein